MPIGGKTRDMTEAAVETYHRHHLDALVCIGGGGTQKNALRAQAGWSQYCHAPEDDRQRRGDDPM